MRFGKWAALLVIVGCGTSVPTQERRDPPSRGAIFVCMSDSFESERCFASSAEGLAKWDLKDAKLAKRAWCVATPARADSNGRLCYLTLDDCTKRAHMDPFSEGACKQQDATVAVLAVDGESQAR